MIGSPGVPSISAGASSAPSAWWLSYQRARAAGEGSARNSKMRERICAAPTGPICADMRPRSSSARKARLFAIHSPVATTMVISDAIAIAHCCLRISTRIPPSR